MRDGLGASRVRSRELREVDGAVEMKEIVSRDPGVVSGELVFAGTRVPVRNLIDYLVAGGSLDAFLDDFPGVGREQAEAYLRITLEAADAVREAPGAGGGRDTASALVAYAGSIPEEDLRLMEEAIEEGCGRVDEREW